MLPPYYTMRHYALFTPLLLMLPPPLMLLLPFAKNEYNAFFLLPRVTAAAACFIVVATFIRYAMPEAIHAAALPLRYCRCFYFDFAAADDIPC